MDAERDEVPGPLTEPVVLEALSDDSARQVIAACATDARSVKEISEVADIPLASTYRHVRSLVDSGILVRARSAISEDGKRFDLFRSRIHDASLSLTPDGIEVRWGVNDDVEERIERLRKDMRY